MRHTNSALRRLAADTAGSIAVVFGLTIVVVLFSVSICLDLVRAYNVRTHLQTALDAAALTGAKLLQEDGATDQKVQTAAAAMFNTYVPNLNLYGLTTSNFKATPDWTNNTVTTTIDAKVTSFFSKIAAGIAPNLSMSPSSTVSYKSDKIEVALVVDVTGSMNQIPAGDSQTKLQSLKQAASIVVDTLMADSPSEDAVRIAVVPFSASVNAGALANSTSASPSVTTCSSTWWWGYSCTTVAGADVDTCVIERDHAHEDTSPTSDKIPAVPSTPYGNYSCPPATVIPLQGKSGVANLKATVNGYAAAGATAGHIGAAWGWYMLSNKWASVLPAASAPLSPTNKSVHKHVIFMTDGQFNTAYLDGPAGANQTADSYGEFQALCSKMRDKNKGNITIWTIGFDLGGLGTTEPEDNLKQCSGADKFFNAPKGSDLIAAFKTIVANMRSMHVSN